MSLGKDRRRIFVKGLGNARVRETEPSTGSSFSNVGDFKSAVLTHAVDMTEVVNDLGQLVNILPQKEMVDIVTELLQTSKSEYDLLRNSFSKVHAFQLYGKTSDLGTFQFYCIEQGRIMPSFTANYQPGERTLPLKVVAVKQDALNYDVPLYYIYEADAELLVDYITLWFDPSLNLNTETTKLLDISGFQRHGTLSSNYESIWRQSTSPKGFLRFDGSEDNVSLGNILNDDGSSDFMIECWVHIQKENDATAIILAKKSDYEDDSAGFALVRNDSNQISFKLSSGSASVSIDSGTSVISNDEFWTHIAVVIDRNGNGQLYLNGVPDGDAVDVSNVGSGSNSITFTLGSDDTNFGEIDLGAVRVHNFGAGGLSSNMSTVILNHYNGEKSKYGI